MRLRYGLIAFTFVFFEFRSKAFEVKCVFQFSQKVFKLSILLRTKFCTVGLRLGLIAFILPSFIFYHSFVVYILLMRY